MHNSVTYPITRPSLGYHWCHHMTLVISMLNKILFFALSSIPMCYAKFCNVNNFSLYKITYVDEYCHVDN